MVRSSTADSNVTAVNNGLRSDVNSLDRTLTRDLRRLEEQNRADLDTLERRNRAALTDLENRLIDVVLHVGEEGVDPVDDALEEDRRH